MLRAHEEAQLGALGNDTGRLPAVGDDDVEAVHGQDLPTQQPQPGDGQGDGAQGAAPHEGLGGGVGEHAGEHDLHAADAEPGLVRQPRD